ncbi:TorD/DmsD family molecular chaperone [Carboxydothermus ferrireducens]|uniref:TorA maturation chaperone TorD n=1 Tax=Carboxydothermus ferrireducens DSM 11255 TaxID=1119529 RepID=A0ABX2R941_9THEO|nr:molecular chaperone TorD family protein [Carboxydothermus ferrireducens]NYE57693.1 TorA maturation chaperone TorD [Carboxydothermus ferrireducens DSM 11255]
MERNRVEIYRLLAYALSEPDLELYRWLKSDGAKAFGKLGVNLGELPGFPELSRQYQEYFGLYAPRVSLIESVYRKWSSDPEVDPVMANSRGFLMSDHALHVAALYEKAGLIVPEDFSGMPDHLVLELEFMAMLVENNHPGQRDFLVDHLSFIERVVEKSREENIRGIYREIVEFLGKFYQEEKNLLLGKQG